FSSSLDRLAAKTWDVLALLDDRIKTLASSCSFTDFSILAALTASFLWLERYLSTIPRIDETASANRFFCLNFEKLFSKDFTLSSNLNKEPKVRRFCREVLGTIVGIETGVVADVE
ncbi:hypothetical protein Tco_0315227, partial [Tanacetum coccineum]